MKNNKNDEDSINIVHLNPRTELSELEKTAILQFKIEEELSKTQKFTLLNKNNQLSNTSKLDLSEINKELEMPVKKTKSSLFNTMTIALDKLIIKRKKAKKNGKVRVLDSLNIKICKKKKYVNVETIYKKKINITNQNFSCYLVSLNIVALTELSKNGFKARKYSNKYKNNNVSDIHINRTEYVKNKEKLNQYAVDNLYYNIAPKETLKYRIYRLLVVVSSLILVSCLIYLIFWWYEGKKIDSITNELNDTIEIKEVDSGEIVTEVDNIDKNENTEQVSLYWKYLNTPLSSVNFDALLAENKDTVGWLIVNNTNIDYPVVQTTNNEYYLKHAFDKSKNSAGWVFADYRNNLNDFNKNTVIYAHGRKDKVMFGTLLNTMDSSWYTNVDNQLIQFSTLEYDTMWQIFSIYKIEKESYYITTDFSSDKSYQLFIDTMKERSIYDFNVNVNVTDKILTLSTCFNDYGIRMVVQAKLVKIQKK